MQFDWIIIAQYAEVTEQGTMNIVGAGIDSLLVGKGSFPVEGELYIAARIVARMEEWRAPGHKLGIRLIAPDGRKYSRHFGLRQIEPPSTLAPGAIPGQLIAVPQSMVLNMEGSYLIQIDLDGHEHYSLIIIVREVKI